MVEALIDRIRAARGVGADLQDIHDTIMAGKDPPTEYDFFLAWKASEVLDALDLRAEAWTDCK